MNNHNKFDINQYFVRWHDGRLTPSEQRTLDAWLANADNRKTWTLLQSVWQVSASLPVPEGTPLDTQWKHLRNRLSVAETRARQTASTVSIFDRVARALPSARVALVGAMAALMMVFAYNYLAVGPQLQVVTVPYGQQLQLVLSDGSEIHLNAGSTFKYPEKFNPSVRLVNLDGEAYFKVRPGETPFTVETDRARTTVLGTEFNVRTWDSATEVYVVSGKVAVHSNNAVQASEVEILPGQLAVCQDGPVDVQPTEHPGALLSWRQGRLVFVNEPLKVVLGDIRRTFNLNIEADPAFLNLTITATFSNEPLEVIAQTLAATLGADLATKDDGFYLRKN